MEDFIFDFQGMHYNYYYFLKLCGLPFLGHLYLENYLHYSWNTFFTGYVKWFIWCWKTSRICWSKKFFLLCKSSTAANSDWNFGLGKSSPIGSWWSAFQVMMNLLIFCFCYRAAIHVSFQCWYAVEFPVLTYISWCASGKAFLHFHC